MKTYRIFRVILAISGLTATSHGSTLSLPTKLDIQYIESVYWVLNKPDLIKEERPRHDLQRWLMDLWPTNERHSRDSSMIHYTDDFDSATIQSILQGGIKCHVLTKSGKSNSRGYQGFSIYSASLDSLGINRDGLAVMYSGDKRSLSAEEAESLFGIKINPAFREETFEWVPPEKITGLLVSFEIERYFLAFDEFRKRKIEKKVLVWPKVGSAENRALSEKLDLPVLDGTIADNAVRAFRHSGSPWQRCNQFFRKKKLSAPEKVE